MKQWVTEIEAKDPFTGDIMTWIGPSVPGISWSDAEDYCQRNGLGYCKVVGELIAEAPCKPGTNEPDWSKKVDYQTYQLN